MAAEAGLCVVAGAGPGMGVAIAKRFAREGFAVALLGRSRERMRTLAEDLRASGVDVEALAVDLADPAAIASAFETLRRSMGDPDVMVYNAAAWDARPAMSLEPAAFMDVLSLTVGGALECARQVYPAMKTAGRGTLLFTGGGLALRPEFGAGVAALTAGKSALRGLVHAMAVELKSDNLHVATVTIAGTVAPGTPFAAERIAEHYWTLHQQQPDAWQTEIVHDGR